MYLSKEALPREINSRSLIRSLNLLKSLIIASMLAKFGKLSMQNIISTLLKQKIIRKMENNKENSKRGEG